MCANNIIRCCVLRDVVVEKSEISENHHEEKTNESDSKTFDITSLPCHYITDSSAVCVPKVYTDRKSCSKSNRNDRGFRTVDVRDTFQTHDF